MPNTEFNPLQDKIIIFYIEIRNNFPFSNPKITCNSNVFFLFFFIYYQFTYPSLFDNRNFSKKTNEENFDLKLTIQKLIPDIYKEYLKNVEKKIFNFIGNYTMKHIYLINEFLENEYNFLFKVSILNQLNYIILTEVCILIFIAYKDKLLRGKLVYVNEIRNVILSEIINPNDLNNFKVEIKFNDNNGLFIYFQNKNECEFFNTIIQDRKSLIYSKMKKFKIIQFDETIESILSFIDYKEKEFNGKKDQKDNLLNELIILYQKAIEFFSNENNEKYVNYLTKLKKLFDK